MAHISGFATETENTFRGRDDVQHLWDGAGLAPAMIRFVGHLPYFKAASLLILPGPIGFGAVVTTTFCYAVICALVSRHLIGAHIGGSARSPLIGTLFVLASMLLIGPCIAILSSSTHSSGTMLGNDIVRFRDLLLPYLGLLLPVCGGFLAIQLLTRPGSPFRI